MKILRIIARLNVGGPARHVIWLTEALNDQEFQTTLVAGTVPPGEDDMRYFADERGVRPEFVREMSREISVSDVRSLLKIFRIIRSEKPDIIHTHTAKAGTLGRTAGLMYKWLTPGTLIGRPKKVRFVHTFHGHVFHSYYSRAKTRAFLAIERLLARAASDRIIVLTEQQLEEITGKFRVGRRDRSQIIPLGIDIDSFAPSAEIRQRTRAELGLADRDIAVGFVGRLTEIKNVPLLLEAAARFSADSRWKFLITGDGHLRPELEAKSRELAIEDTVRFLGNRSDVSDLYNAFDLVALTSLNEGTPLSLIEAMAAGKPVVATAVGGVRDLLGEARERQNGFTVCERGIRIETLLPEDFQRGLQYLVENEELGRKLAARANEFAKRTFSKQRLISDIKELYRGLAKE